MMKRRRAFHARFSLVNIIPLPNAIFLSPRQSCSSLRRSFALPDHFFCKMNNCHHVQKNAFVACEDIRGGAAWIAERKDPIICPKPRRVGILSNNPNRSLRWCISRQVEASDSGAGTELLDLILAKEGATQIASSPPFFTGSPPSRAGNPLTQDARFGDERVTPLSTLSISSPTGVSSPTSSPAHKSGCARMKFGLKPAAVRVEGFDCLNRDGRNSHIPAFA